MEVEQIHPPGLAEVVEQIHPPGLAEVVEHVHPPGPGLVEMMEVEQVHPQV